jgi:hypothetical protein
MVKTRVDDKENQKTKPAKVIRTKKARVDSSVEIVVDCSEAPDYTTMKEGKLKIEPVE